MITHHMNAKKGDFSSLVIMSGDPIRVKYISDFFLDSSYQITNVRSMLGFTGYYKDTKVSIMSHGMGIPSVSIYMTELVKYYQVRKIIRLGTCGTIRDDLNLHDIIIAMGACTDSNVNRIKFNNYDFSAIADFNMIFNAVKLSKKNNLNIYVGNFFTTDSFYNYDNKIYDLLDKYQILGIDMETAGIYSLASEFNIPAMSICSVSDHIKKQEHLSYNDREFTCNSIIKIALDTIIL